VSPKAATAAAPPLQPAVPVAPTPVSVSPIESVSLAPAGVVGAKQVLIDGKLVTLLPVDAAMLQFISQTSSATAPSTPPPQPVSAAPVLPTPPRTSAPVLPTPPNAGPYGFAPIQHQQLPAPMAFPGLAHYQQFQFQQMPPPLPFGRPNFAPLPAHSPYMPGHLGGPMMPRMPLGAMAHGHVPMMPPGAVPWSMHGMSVAGAPLTKFQ